MEVGLPPTGDLCAPPRRHVGVGQALQTCKPFTVSGLEQCRHTHNAIGRDPIPRERLLGYGRTTIHRAIPRTTARRIQAASSSDR